MSQLIDQVGLSSSFTEKTSLLLSNIESQLNKSSTAAQSVDITKRIIRGTERASEASKALRLLSNRSYGNDSNAIDSIDEPSASPSDQHLRVLQRINEDK